MEHHRSRIGRETLRSPQIHSSPDQQKSRKLVGKDILFGKIGVRIEEALHFKKFGIIGKNGTCIYRWERNLLRERVWN